MSELKYADVSAADVRCSTLSSLTQLTMTACLVTVTAHILHSVLQMLSDITSRERKIGYSYKCYSWCFMRATMESKVLSGSDFLIEILEIIYKMLLSSHTEVISLEWIWTFKENKHIQQRIHWIKISTYSWQVYLIWPAIKATKKYCIPLLLAGNMKVVL